MFTYIIIDLHGGERFEFLHLDHVVDFLEEDIAVEDVEDVLNNRDFRWGMEIKVEIGGE